MTTVETPAGHDAKCGSKLSKGKPGTCTQPAGWGTDHVGIGYCKLHGGSTPNHQTAARNEQARRDVELFAARRDIRPAEALLELVQWTAGEVDYWRQRVRELGEDDLTWGVTKVKEGGDDRGTTEEAKPNIAYVMLTDASNRLERYASSALKAGADAAMVQIARSQGAQLAAVLRQGYDAQFAWIMALGRAGVEQGLTLQQFLDQVEGGWAPNIASVLPPILRAIGPGDETAAS